MSTPSKPSPIQVYLEDMNVAMDVCGAVTYEDGAKIIALYREQCEQAIRDEYNQCNETCSETK